MSGLDAAGMQQAFGQALKIIGGIPILKNMLGHTVDKLKLPMHLDIGKIPNILAAVQSGGIGALLQSPLGAALGSLTGTIGVAQGALSGLPGVSSLTGALSGLSGSATSLSALADNLMGFTNVTSLPGQLDLVGHLNLAQGLGDAIPAALSLATAAAPIGASDLLAGVQSQVTGIAAAVVGGTQPIADGTVAVAALAASLDAVRTGSTGAIATLAAAAPALCAASSTIALVTAGPSELRTLMRAGIRPDMLAAVDAAVAAHLADLAVAPVELD